MDIVQINPEELIEYASNPRKNENAVEAVAASIKEFGFLQPIVIDDDKVIVAGHTRAKAARKLGLKKVPCVIASKLSEQQIRAFRIIDNRLHEFAEWDTELLKLEVDALGDFNFEALHIDSWPIPIGEEFEQLEASTDRLDETALIECPECGAKFEKK